MGYHIEKEDMVLEDGKYYPMMKVVRGEYKTDWSIGVSEGIREAIKLEKITEADVFWLFDEYGECLLKERHPVLRQFLVKEKTLYEEILANLYKQDTEKSEIRQKEIKEKLKYINLGLEWFEHEV